MRSSATCAVSAAEDGTVALDLSKVVYVLVDHEEHRVGFGT
jgi:hypothetical protein